MNDNIKTIVEATDTLNPKQQALFFKAFTGALAVVTDPRTWKQCLDIAKREMPNIEKWKE